MRHLSPWEVRGDIAQIVSQRKPRGASLTDYPEGRFSIDLDRLGDAVVSAQTSDGLLEFVKFSDLKAGQLVDDVTITLRPDESAKIDVVGTVLGRSGSPIADAHLFPRNPPFPLMNRLLEQPRELKAALDRFAVGQSDAQGAFRVTGLAPPIDMITAWHSDYARGWTTQPLVAGETNNINLILEKGGQVERTISLDGVALAQGEVHVIAGGRQANVSIGSEGTYSCDRLTAGLQRIRCFLDLEGVTSSVSPQWLQALLEIKEGQITTVDFNFVSDNDAQRKGVVTFQDATFPSARVEIWSENSDATQTRSQTKTGEDGYYYFEGLPAGELQGRVSGLTIDGKPAQQKFLVETQGGQLTQYAIKANPAP